MSKPFMTVENAQGKTVELELVDTIQVDSFKYIIVSEMDSDNAFAYRVDEDHGKPKYSSIGNGSEFRKVLEKYNEKHMQH
ncbi:DUF1292 domain-containing protein [Hathewaya histolytica]|uniref:Protein of uncharacterized function (DUF1292) n=1 Tax=Hathewaya histolytica TaxID=1498 RepID=A0A4U9R532_HATHI|nr:DUF1292 domain-containing protein [Hathewaya histolytica]VTQ86524.1 Protein of uncharacterised function (DUF1292) [Hathewaya histolytica]